MFTQTGVESMGLFLSIFGIIGVESNDVMNVLTDYAQSHRDGFQLAEGICDNPNIGVITRSGPNTTVLYP